MKRFLFVIVILLITKAGFAQFPLMPGTTLPVGNLQAWYPFCYNYTPTITDTTDEGGTGYNLNNNNLAPTTDRFGVPNAAWLFNGSNSRMFYTTTFPLFAVPPTNFGYSVWIYPTAVQNSVILHNGNPNADGIGIIMNNGVFGGGPGNFVSVIFAGTTQVLATSVILNQWHHLVVTRTGNGFYFYVDDVQIGFYVPPVPPGFTAPTTVFQLGIDNTDGSDPFTGKIDDVAIYDRFLGPADVHRLYEYTPDIVFSLGGDITTCANLVTLMPDTTTWKNALYNGSPAWYNYKYNSIPFSGLVDESKYDITFPTGSPTNDTVIFLELERQYSCATRDTIRVTHIAPLVNLGNDTVFCKGSNALILDAGSSSGVSFLWSTGSTADTIAVTVTGIYSVIKDSAGCVAYDTVKVTVADSITATLTGSFISPLPGAPGPFVVLPRDTILCQGGSFDLKPQETYGTPVYSWQDGITVTSTLNAAVTNTYWIQVVDSGCVTSDTVTVTIVYDTVTVFTPDTAVCKGATFVATASNAPGISYQWVPTTGIPVSSTSTPTITPDTTAWYVVTATVLSCNVKDSFRVDVQPFPIVNMGGNRNICEFDTIHIAPVVSPFWYTGYIYNWTPGTFLDDSVATNVVFTAGDTTKLVLVVTTPAGCSGADSAIIYKYNGNFASMKTDTVLCPGDSVKLFPLSTEPGPTTYVWHPATFIDDSTAGTPVIRPITSLSYTGIATSQYGCNDTLTFAVGVKPAAVISMVDSVVLFPGETYQISPITNATNYTWFPDLGLSDTGIVNPVANPPVSTKYILTVRTEEGCTAVDSINIRVDALTVLTVPNAFTPGSGGPNSVIRPILRGIARLRYFRIYNRYGNMVFEGKQITDGWDGTIGGVPQLLGVYVYEAEAVTDKGAIIRKQGNITLLR